MKKVLFYLLAFIPGILIAQDIIIDKDLANNSEVFKVKIGTQRLGKIAKYKFSEYSVVESKNGWVKSRGYSNFFGTKEEKETKQKFSFVLSDGSSNMATVNAATNVNVKMNREVEIFAGFYSGDNELRLAEHNFTATLFLNQDTANLWLLFMKKSIGTEANDYGGAFLTNDEKKIDINSVSSKKNASDKGLLPAMGYEFLYDEKSLCALQYFGGGILGANKIFIWLRTDLDQEMKLLLSAAMTAILQKESTDLDLIDID